MDRQLFLERLGVATERALTLARGMVTNALPDQVRYRVLLNQSYDGNPLGPDEQVFLRDMAARDLLLGSPEEVVANLWRDGRVPEWIDVSVRAADERSTDVQLLCCGRFIARDEVLHHQREGLPPFHVLGPPMPPGKWNDKDRQPFDLFWRRRLNKRELASHYPEVVRHGGSMASLLGADLRAAGSPLDVRQDEDSGAPRPVARARHDGRTVEVLPAAKERSCSAQYWDRGVHLATFKTGDPDPLVRSVRAWCLDRLSPGLLADRCPGVELDRDRVAAFEAGPDAFVSYYWQVLLAAGEKRLSPAIRGAAEVPALRRLRPFVTTNRLGFSRCTGFPFTGDGPLIVPVLGQERFQVIGRAGMPVGTGTAVEAAALAASHLPPDGGPVQHGTADELQ